MTYKKDKEIGLRRREGNRDRGVFIFEVLPFPKIKKTKNYIGFMDLNRVPSTM